MKMLLVVCVLGSQLLLAVASQADCSPPASYSEGLSVLLPNQSASNGACCFTGFQIVSNGIPVNNNCYASYGDALRAMADLVGN